MKLRDVLIFLPVLYGVDGLATKSRKAKVSGGCEPRAVVVQGFSGRVPAQPLSFTTLPTLWGPMAEGLGIERPAFTLKPLPDFDKSAPTLPRDVFLAVLYAKAKQQNWGDVAYAASGHRGVADKLRATWAMEDARLTVTAYMAQLNPAQQELIELAFKGMLADRPPTKDFPPAEVDRSWLVNFLKH